MFNFALTDDFLKYCVKVFSGVLRRSELNPDYEAVFALRAKDPMRMTYEERKSASEYYMKGFDKEDVELAMKAIEEYL